MKKSDILQSFRKRMGERTFEEKQKTERKLMEYLAEQRWLEEQGYEYNTDKSYSLKLLNDDGYFPIGIATIACEESFIFKTEKEADIAWKSRVLGNEGWWYGKRNFLKYLEEYQKDMKTEVKIYWIDDKQN